MNLRDIENSLVLLDEQVQGLEVGYETRDLSAVEGRTLRVSRVVQQLRELSKSDTHMAQSFESPLWLISNSLNDLATFGAMPSPQWDDIGAVISFISTGRDILREAFAA
jgi:hypothetical protein